MDPERKLGFRPPSGEVLTHEHTHARIPLEQDDWEGLP
ncbi:hypothetical protein D187_007157 [Cystobacter fuscus DSM 2262]|uniref:Uncharacterized protein n=1 Tax=Cystobacter fuscus (strain ATCC 25194 / DSM 2262 / NBRC 100088 / M29) TaxID=1242864 RepID=S9QLM1_CYSF2|nr:hypothetical protein D187_007157 [Cystobacter fuscus DSM 2262]